jgi:acyl carrier protein
MADAAAQAQLARAGVTPFAPAEALTALAHLLGGAVAQAVVARVEWRVLKELFELRGAKPFFSALVPTGVASSGEPAGPSPRVAALAQVAKDARGEALESFLQDEVAVVLGCRNGQRPDARQGFFALGMDSLMAVDLRNRLSRAFGCALPATLVFDHANIRLLAAFLAREALGWSESEATPVAASGPPPEPAEGGDLDAALAARLARLETLVKND